jgi:hypothetical protein
MPRAGICIVFFVIKGVIFAQFQTLFGFEELRLGQSYGGSEKRVLHNASAIHRRNPIAGF